MEITNVTVEEQEVLVPKKKHISFSELYVWNKCPFLHKKQYIEKVVPSDKSHYLSFGTSLHHICEHHIYEELDKQNEIFRKHLSDNINEQQIPITDKELDEYCSQASKIFLNIMPVLLKTFGEGFKIIHAELPLYERIDFFDGEEYYFKGYIDLVIEDAKGKVHLIDWKTTSWGWDLRKRTDKMTTYQLTLYKIFYAKKFNINPKDISLHFILLKRTAKPDNNVEVFTVPCGEIKMKNCKDFLNKALYNITKGVYIKNRNSCGFCSIYKTDLCP